jgi:hypothetical protein
MYSYHFKRLPIGLCNPRLPHRAATVGEESCHSVQLEQAVMRTHPRLSVFAKMVGDFPVRRADADDDARHHLAVY